MLCRRARNWIGLSLDGMLPPDRTVALTEHLAKCTGCRAYREEMQLGQRLLAATAPRLSDNFEWRLQIKLNQTLQEAAREATSPWEVVDQGWRRWLQGAAVAAVGGVAVVVFASSLLLRAGAPLLGAVARSTADSPVVAAGAGSIPASDPAGAHAATVISTAGDASRTSFSQMGFRVPLESSRLGTAVNSRFLLPYGATPGREGWSDVNAQSLSTIAHLREQNLRLRDQLAQAQHEVFILRAQTGGGAGAAHQDSVPPVRH